MLLLCLLPAFCSLLQPSEAGQHACLLPANPGCNGRMHQSSLGHCLTALQQRSPRWRMRVHLLTHVRDCGMLRAIGTQHCCTIV
jgi:hypothetical protein